MIAIFFEDMSKYFKDLFIFNFCVLIFLSLYVCFCIMFLQSPQWEEEGIGFPDIGDIDSCGITKWVLGKKPSFLGEQLVFLTT